MIEDDELDYKIAIDNRSGNLRLDKVPDHETPLTEYALQSALDISERDLVSLCSAPSENIRINPNRKYLTKWKMIHGMITQLCNGNALSEKQSTWMSTNYVGGCQKLLDDMEEESNARKLIKMCEHNIKQCM